MRKPLSTAEAATELGVTPRRVLALISAGRLRAVRVGRDWIIAAKDLDSVRTRPPGRPGKKSAKSNGEG